MLALQKPNSGKFKMKSEIERLTIGELMKNNRISFEDVINLARKVKKWEGYLINEIGELRKKFIIDNVWENYHGPENEIYLREYIEKKVIEFKGELENIKIRVEDEGSRGFFGNSGINDDYLISASYKGVHLAYYRGSKFAEEEKHMTSSEKKKLREIYISIRNNVIKEHSSNLKKNSKNIRKLEKRVLSEGLTQVNKLLNR